jgi:hypothetical protein
MSSKARVAPSTPLDIKGGSYSFQPKLLVEMIAILACGWAVSRVLNLGLFWLIAVALSFPLAWAAAALQQRFVLGSGSRVLSSGERLAWWLGTALYAFTLAEPAGAVAVDSLRIALRATVAESMVGGAGSLVTAAVFLILGILSWNVRHVLDLKQIAGSTSAAGVSVISWLLLLLPVATLMQFGLRPESSPDPGRTVAMFACIALTCTVAVWRLIWFRPRSHEGSALVVLIPESTISARVVSTINAFAARWRRGPVTVIARPAEAARLSGRFAHLAASAGALPALIPRSLPELSDSQAFLAPADEWRSIPVREIYPTPGLWPETVRRFVNDSARVLVITTHARGSARKFTDLPAPAAELIDSVRRALPVRQPLYRLSPPSTERDSVWPGLHRTLFSTATRMFVRIVRSTLDISVAQDSAKGTRALFVVHAGGDQKRARLLAAQLHGKKDASGLRMIVKLLPYTRHRLSYSGRLLQLIRALFGTPDPIMEIAVRRLWLNPRAHRFLRYLAPHADPRLGGEMDILVIASGAFPKQPDTLWHTLASNAQAGVFTRAIVAFPRRHEWNNTLLPCDIELARPTPEMSEVDVVADWARRLLANDLSPFVVDPQPPTPVPNLRTDLGASAPPEQELQHSSVADPAALATQFVCNIRSARGKTLGTGILIPGRSGSDAAATEPVVLTTVPLDGLRPASVALDFPLQKMTCNAAVILPYQQSDLDPRSAPLYRFSVIRLLPPFPQTTDLTFGEFTSLSADPDVTIVGFSPDLPHGLGMLQGKASLQRRDTTPDLLAYTTPGPSISFGGALFDRHGRLIALQCPEVPSSAQTDQDIRDVSLALPIRFILRALRNT